jgi:ATP-dependent DNA ligase
MNAIIYKKDSKGKLRYLKVYTEGATVYQESGLLDGNPVTHEHICVGKNIGKTNETTPEEQAELEGLAKIEAKMTKGYFLTIPEAQNEVVILPTLAKSFKSEKKKIDWTLPVFAQPKLDGMRCLAFVKESGTVLLSRTGKEITTVPHINKALNDSSFNNYILDGELYVHEESFQENMRLIKKYREGETEKVKFVVYDIITDKPYSARYSDIKMLIRNFPEDSPIELIDNYHVLREEDIKEIHERFISQGYEGSMIRHGKEGYPVNKRSNYLLKNKDFIDIAVTIKDIIPSTKRPEWGVPVFELDGKTFRAGTKIPHEQRKNLLKDKNEFIGKTAELRFFEYSDTGVPRFPVMVGLRLDK